jgi:hypothetical protein
VTKINITNVAYIAADVDVDMVVDMAANMDAEVYMMWLSRPIYLWANIKSSPCTLADYFWPTNYFNPTHNHFQNSAFF